jgi:hypothetical protein
MAVVQELEILRFGLLKISAGMMSHSALQELKKKWRSPASALIGRHVPAFILE